MPFLAPGEELGAGEQDGRFSARPRIREGAGIGGCPHTRPAWGGVLGEGAEYLTSDAPAAA